MVPAGDGFGVGFDVAVGAAVDVVAGAVVGESAASLELPPQPARTTSTIVAITGAPRRSSMVANPTTFRPAMWKSPNMGTTQRAIIIGVTIAVAAGLFILGRVTSDGDDGNPRAGFLSGLRQGESRGIREGRALQLSETLPENSRDATRKAFDAGYTAGANDAFGGYDGGWYVSRPYVITLVKGTGPITYDLGSRTLLHAETDYYLCSHTRTICQRPHR